MTTATWAAWACALLMGINLASIALAARRLRVRTRLPRPGPDAPPVTIVRPVCGIEPNLDETLRAGFALDYPAYEIVFCVERNDDAVIPLVRRLMAAHPAIPSRLLVGEDRISGNPKLNNCVKGWDAAQHDWIVLADSNVLMPPDYIQQMMAAWRPDTGLVCSTPLGTRAVNFPGWVECAFLNTLQARWQYAGEGVGLGFAQGKSMLWQRDFLDSHGGIRALAREIAEDAAATKLVRAAGRHVHLVNTPFEQPLGPRSLRQVWDRQVRWARLRRVTFPAFYAPELFSGAFMATVIGGLAAAAAGWSVILAVLAVLIVSYGAEAALAWFRGWPLSWRLVAAMPVRDLMIPAMWVTGWTTGVTVWRGNAVGIGEPHGVANAVDSPAPSGRA